MINNILVKLNNEYDVNIIDQNNMGEGVAKINNFTIFVENALLNESGTILITEVKKNYAKGKMVAIKIKSPDRIDSLCDKYSICGGCDLQHQIYESQLKFKQKKLIDVLTRIGKFKNIEINNIVGMDKPMYYRNKAVFHINNSNIGFYQRKSHNVIDINKCFLTSPLINKTYLVLREGLSESKLDITEFMIREGVNTNEIMVVLYAKYYKDKFNNLIDKLCNEIEELKTIVVSDNHLEHVLYGEGFIKEKLLNNYFKISPKSFFQTNTYQAEKLYQIIQSYIDDSDKLILDLYTGAGGIALSVSNHNNKIVGIEIGEDAIKDAIYNASLNNISNATFILSDTNNIEKVIINNYLRPDVIILDPPRRGCDIKTLDLIKKMEPKKIIYVSCDPATLARDLNYLIDEKYKIDEISLVDMFPNTFHVETIVFITKA